MLFGSEFDSCFIISISFFFYFFNFFFILSMHEWIHSVLNYIIICFIADLFIWISKSVQMNRQENSISISVVLIYMHSSLTKKKRKKSYQIEYLMITFLLIYLYFIIFKAKFKSNPAVDAINWKWHYLIEDI